MKFRTVALPILMVTAALLLGQEGGCEEDADGDGWTAADGDCNDRDDTVYPGATELCNGLDDDCDEVPDSGIVGDSAECAVDSCAAILETRADAEDGVYWITLNQAYDPFHTYCDMSTAAGGWTLAFASMEFMAIIDADPGVSWQNFDNRSITDFENPTDIMEGHAVPSDASEALWMCSVDGDLANIKWWQSMMPAEVVDNAHSSGGHSLELLSQSDNTSYVPTSYVEGSSNYPSYRYWFIADGTNSCDSGNTAMWGGSCFYYECASSSGYCAAYRKCDGANSDGSAKFWLFWR